MDTPFEEILHTNSVPSDTECSCIRELLVGPLKEAAELTAEIERLQSLIFQLTEKRARLNGFIHPHLALISPMRRLPDDVVAQIFIACLPSDRNAVMSSSEAPLLLCHVCHAWRTIALSTPHLWTSLHIVASEKLSKLHQINEAVDIWLSRSGVLPLSISLVRSWTSRDEADFSVLVETVIRYSSRWNRMRFQLQSKSYPKSFSALSPNQIPILVSFSFDGFQKRYDRNAIPLHAAPSLRRISLSCVVGSILLLPLCWNRLRHLFIGPDVSSSLTAAEGLQLLGQCPDLEACSLALRSSSANVAPTLLSRRMVRLRQLSVVDHDNLNNTHRTTDFFQNLDLPALRTLEYVTEHVQQFPFIPLLASSNILQRLSLSAMFMSSEPLTTCLRLVPELRELRIHHDPYCTLPPLGAYPPNDFWVSMTPTAQNLHISCPKLRIVEFAHFGPTSDDTLLIFIQARSSTGTVFSGIARLEKVHVEFKRAMQVDIRPALKQAISDGLDLSLRYQHSASIIYSPFQENFPHTRGEMLSDRWAVS